MFGDIGTVGGNVRGHVQGNIGVVRGSVEMHAHVNGKVGEVLLRIGLFYGSYFCGIDFTDCAELTFTF